MYTYIYIQKNKYEYIQDCIHKNTFNVKTVFFYNNIIFILKYREYLIFIFHYFKFFNYYDLLIDYIILCPKL